jgi:hypothetical protein
MQRPRITRAAESLLNPLVGKSVAMYFTKRQALKNTESEATLGNSVASD